MENKAISLFATVRITTTFFPTEFAPVHLRFWYAISVVKMMFCVLAEVKQVIESGLIWSVFSSP
jgi:hypothetical protein